MPDEKPARRKRAAKAETKPPTPPVAFYEIKIQKPHKAIVSPASLLLFYARATEDAGFRYVSEREIDLRFGGRFYRFDHMEIEPADKKTDSITLYLTEIIKTESEAI